MKIKIKDNRIYSGEYIGDYIKELTSDPELVVTSWIRSKVIPHQWELKTISINEVLKDPDFVENWKAVESGNEDPRYDEEIEDLTITHLRQPIVLFQDGKETLLIDGYSRTIRHLLNGDNTIKAYVNIKE